MDSSMVDKVLNLSQQILQSQNTILTAMLGIAALLLACTWVWNFFISKKQIKNEIQEKISKIEKDFGKRIDSKMGELENTIKEKLNADLLTHEAEINRLFALICDDRGSIGACISWWCDALLSYKKMSADKFIRISTDAILRNLKKEKSCESLDKNEIKVLIDQIKENVPLILEKEREEILKILETEFKKK